MPQQVQLAHLGKARGSLAADALRERRLGRRRCARGFRRLRKANGAAAGLRAFEDERLDHDERRVVGGRGAERPAAAARIVLGRPRAVALGDTHRVASNASARAPMASSVVSSVQANSSVSPRVGSSLSRR